MSQRNPQNERYSDENRKGKTRKSAASAKPSSGRAATVRGPAPKSKKQKKEERRQREEKRDQQLRAMAPDARRFEEQPEYKRLRRYWWICLIAAIACIAVSFLTSRTETLTFLYIPLLVAGYVLVIVAFYIDLGKIRKMRKKYEQTQVLGKSKQARAAQKKARAEARAQQKEAEEKFEEAQAAKEEKKANGILGFFRKPKADQPSTEADEAPEKAAAAEKADKGDKGGKSDKASKTDQADKADQPEQADKPADVEMADDQVADEAAEDAASTEADTQAADAETTDAQAADAEAADTNNK